MHNPFEFVGSSSLKENFVGRKKLIEEIERRAIYSEMTFLVGLPRMGKTSLIWHIFLESGKPEFWLEEHRFYPLLFDISTCSKAKDLWGSMALEISLALGEMQITQQLNSESITEVYDLCNQAEDAEDGYIKLKGAIQKIFNCFGIRFVFIFDELDYLWKYKYNKEDFMRLRCLSSYAHIITCSRRTPEHIEKLSYGSNYFSNKKDDNIFVGVFTQSDVDQYWNHFASAFSMLDKTVRKQYKKLVARYAGNHPNLMNILNSFAFKHGSIEEWRQVLNTDKRYLLEFEFRRSLVDAFDDQMHYIEEQELDQAAINAVVGGVLPSDNKIDDLLKYNFIEMVPVSQKRDMFGYDIGPTTNDGQYRYVCLSEFFSHYMREKYHPIIKGAELLEMTELKLRDLVRDTMKNKYGENAFDVVNGSENSRIYYKEGWEDSFRNDFEELYNALWIDSNDLDSRKDFKSTIASLKNKRWKRTQNDCRPSHERSAIDIISSTTLGQLWNMFICWLWEDGLSSVLDKDNVVQGNKNSWYNAYFSDYLELRNATNHYYRGELTESFIEETEEKCRKICRLIDENGQEVRTTLYGQ